MAWQWILTPSSLSFHLYLSSRPFILLCVSWNDCDTSLEDSTSSVKTFANVLLNKGDVWSHSRNFNECPSTQFTWASSAGLVVSSIVRYSDKKLYSYHVVGPLHKHYMYLMFLTGQCCEVLLNDCLVGGDGPCTLQHKGVKILVGARWKHFTGTNLPHFLNPRCRDPYEV